jgi:RNA 2',3'-cyclic 3'-phosphodiesterase
VPGPSENIRAFVALYVSAEVEGAIGDLIDELREPGDGIKWVARTNLHLTLKFLGPAVPVAQIEAIKPMLESVAAETAPFELIAAGVGAFPGLERPRVLWVGLEAPALMDLARRTDEAATRCGFEPERRPFAAHLTIARVSSPRGWNRTRRALETVRERQFGSSLIPEMTLYRSTLTPKGSKYEALAVFPFTARA